MQEHASPSGESLTVRFSVHFSFSHNEVLIALLVYSSSGGLFEDVKNAQVALLQ